MVKLNASHSTFIIKLSYCTALLPL